MNNVLKWHMNVVATFFTAEFFGGVTWCLVFFFFNVPFISFLFFFWNTSPDPKLSTTISMT